jgi:3-phenylpropionate/trans-cinnamate dioxygenase ferredoxin reductase component
MSPAARHDRGMNAGQRTIVIAGAGLAAAKAAETLRAEGFDGELVLVGAEDVRPYERPPLSKDLLRGESEREDVFVHTPEFYDEQRIELLTGRSVRALDTRSSRVELDDGRALGYDALLLATGAEPRRLELPGSELGGLESLRTLDDCDVLRERLDKSSAVVIVGGGWIGCEVAASARSLGLDVTILETAPLPLERVLGPQLAAFYADVHRDHGVTILGGEGVEAFEGDARVERVRTTGGRALDCDLILVAVGVAPRTALAEEAGLDVDDGIVTDARLATSAPGVFAAGDVARHAHPQFGPLRIEHWHNALEQGPAAARAMLGDETPYDRVPYFFSDQYDVGMEYAGHAAGADRVVFRGDPATREFVAFWLRDDRVLAGMNVNVWDVTDDIQALVRSDKAVDERALRDPDVPLDRL